MNIYVAGPMRGYPAFNFPAFFDASAGLRAAGHTVLNPAERDNEHHGTDISAGNASGDLEQAARDHGFSLREALGADTAWICKHAGGIYMLEGWAASAGARAEKALAEALGLEVFYQSFGAAGERTPTETGAYDRGYVDGVEDCR